MTLLDRSFFDRSVHVVAREVLGCTLLVGGVGGRIVEVEAYQHTEPASHAFRGETARNRAMFGAAGHAYVYRSYGIHWCLNLVCEPQGTADAILVRALEPTHGLEVMRERRRVDESRLLCAGPGRLCEALGVTSAHDGLALDEPPFALSGADEPAGVVVGTRIGVTKAADLPWRYGLAGSAFVSRPFNGRRRA